MGCDVMRISALDQLRIFDADGTLLGRLEELEAVNGRIERLVYGKAGFFERMTGRKVRTKHPWSDVARVDAQGIHLSR
jgi:sporulation protein YlmC with PRC-barrel domain